MSKWMQYSWFVASPFHAYAISNRALCRAKTHFTIIRGQEIYGCNITKQ